jgi:large conductance mechanosensitive channel
MGHTIPLVPTCERPADRKRKGKKKMLKGFRDFILRGNVMDLAVAFIMGAAFNAIVSSLVKDVIMQLIAAVVGKQDFSALKFDLNSTPIMIGNFVNAAVSFLIVAFVVYFFMVLPINKLMAKFKGPTPETPPATKACPECLSEIPIAAKRCSHCTQAVA